MEAELFVLAESPKEAADAIRSALEFLTAEADAIGLDKVSELLQRASEKAAEQTRDAA